MHSKVRPAVNGKAGFRARGIPNITAIVIALFWSGTSFAQALEEVVVTAERRAQSAQEVPISVSVLTGEDLQKQGVFDIYDMQRAAPSLAVQQQGRTAFVNIRGIGTAAQLPVGVPGVAFYLDGQFVSHEFFVTDSFYDLQAVEVVRGPQGTLAGQNSTGGAIYLRSVDPQYDAVSGYADLTYADYDRIRAVAALNLPVSENAAIRFAAVKDKRDGYWDCILDCRVKDLGSLDQEGFRANLQWEPTESVKLNLRAEITKTTSAQQAWQNVRYMHLGPYVASIDGKTYIDKDAWRVSGETLINLSDSVDLRGIVSFQDYTMGDQGDNDRSSEELPVTQGGASSIVTAEPTHYDDVLQAELNLISRGNSALQWVLGAFYYEETGSFFYATDRSARYEFGENGPVPALIQNIPVTSKSLFGQVDYRFAEDWELTFGLRFNDDEQKVERISVNGLNDVDSVASAKKTTGRGGLKYFASDQTMVYGTFSRGYKAGGNNPLSFQGPFDEETVDTFEFGTKTEMLDNRLRVNADVFISSYTGLQLLSRQELPGLPPLPYIQNASDVDSKGAELEALGSFEEWTLNFGLTYLDNKFAAEDVLFNASTNAWETVPVGRRMPYSAEWQANAGIERSMQLGSWLVTPRLNVSYMDDYTTGVFQSFDVGSGAGLDNTIESHTLVDLRVTAVPSEHWLLEAFVTNLFDKEWISSKAIGRDPRTWGVDWAPPRIWGVRARYEF